MSQRPSWIRLTAAAGNEERETSANVETRRISQMVVTTKNAITFTGDLTIDEWQRLGKHIWVIADSSSWWIGDWLVYGQDRYPDRYREAISDTSLDYQTLKNYAWVARKFSRNRRRDKLSFQHHVEVAALPPTEQDLWLDRADKLGWSRDTLRRELRVARGLEDQDEKQAECAITIKITSSQRQRWQDGALVAGRELEPWIREVLDGAALTATCQDDDDARGKLKPAS